MADPMFYFMDVLKSLPENRETALTKLLTWYRSRGGEAALVAFLREMKEEVLEKVVKALQLPLAPSTRGNNASSRRNQILQYFIEMDKQATMQAASKPCHWCSQPSAVVCVGCAKHTVHHYCLLERVPALPEHLDNRYCRGCAKQKFDLWVKHAQIGDLQGRAKDIGVQPCEKRSEIIKRLRAVCSFDAYTRDEQYQQAAPTTEEHAQVDMEDTSGGELAYALYKEALARRWSPFNLEWQHEQHQFYHRIKQLKRSGRIRVAKMLEALPWKDLVLLLSDQHVSRELLHRNNYDASLKKNHESWSAFRRSWLINDGRKSFKPPDVPFTDAERKNMSYHGKRKLTAEEHRKSGMKTAKSQCKSRAEKYKAYEDRCDEKGVPKQPRATYHLIKPSLSMEQMKQKLKKLSLRGVIKNAPQPCNYFRFNSLIGYNTNELCLVPARSLPCYQAALVAATGCSIEALGLPLNEPLRKGLSFRMMNTVLQESSGLGRQFVLMKDIEDSETDSALDVFSRGEGVYIIHSYYFHEEDVGCSYAQPIHHYIVYNAGTRVLFLYPELLVLEDEDIADLASFAIKLQEVPFQTKLSVDKGSYARKVRRVVIKNCEESKALPLSSHSCITK